MSFQAEINQDFITNVYRSSRKVAVILVRF